MRRMMRNYMAYAFTLTILLMINGSEQGSSSSSRFSSSADSSTSISSNENSRSSSSSNGGEDDPTGSKAGISPSGTTPCGYASMAGYTLTEDAKGKHHNDIVTYSILQYSTKLSKKEVDDVIRRAFQAWSDVSPLAFKQKDSGKTDITITFSMQVPMAATGFSYFPNQGARVTFNDRFNWTIDKHQGKNLRQTATHEIGHALGLDHSEHRNAVMYPQYPPYCPPDFKLDRDDVLAIQALYGKPPTSKTKTDSSPEPRNTEKEQPRTGKDSSPTNDNWRTTPKGSVYWPPVQRKGYYVTWLWDGKALTTYYFDQSSRGWFPAKF